MRRIKIVVSDFHLGAGRQGVNGAINDHEDFVSDRAFVDMLEYYRTAEYADAEVELILNGDTFEFLGLTDPDDPDPDVITARKSLAKVDQIIDGHAELFDAVRTFADGDRRSVTVMVGNHDQDLLFEEVQARLKARVHPDLRILPDVYFFDGVHLEHGHQHDRHNSFESGKIFLTKGLPEPILNLPWGSDFFISTMLPLKNLRPYINRVRPLRLAVWWSLFHDFTLLLRIVWYTLVAIIGSRFRRLKQRRIMLWTSMKMIFGLSITPTMEDAATKVMREDDRVHTVIFGHTHLPLSRQIFTGRRYLNSGAWIPTVNLHISALGQNLQQTYIYVEYEGARPLATLKVWHGRRVVEEDVAS